MIPDFIEQEELSDDDVAIIDMLPMDKLDRLTAIQLFLEEILEVGLSPYATIIGCIDSIYEALFYEDDSDETCH